MKRDSIEFPAFYCRYLIDAENRIIVIIFSGSLDKEPVLRVKQHIQDLVTKKQYNFIVDLTYVSYISSTGLGFLMYLSKYKEQYAFLSFPPEEIQKPFKLLELDEYFQFYSNPDELKTRAQVPPQIVRALKDETAIVDVHYKMRWMNILRGYVSSHEELMKEIDRMRPYLHDAENEQSLSLPSEEKFVCVLYRFLDRIFRQEAHISSEEIDEALVELIAKELITNAVKHGYANRKDGIIEAHYAIDDEKLHFTLTDFGKGFSSPEPRHDLFPSAGLKLLDKLFDEVVIRRAPKKKVPGIVLGKGTQVSMTKYLKPRHLRKT
jgi:anti-anti-sigma factor